MRAIKISVLDSFPSLAFSCADISKNSATSFTQNKAILNVRRDFFFKESITCLYRKYKREIVGLCVMISTKCRYATTSVADRVSYQIIFQSLMKLWDSIIKSKEFVLVMLTGTTHRIFIYLFIRLIAEVRYFGAVPARTTATDRELQRGFGRFLYPGNPEITVQPVSSCESS